MIGNFHYLALELLCQWFLFIHLFIYSPALYVCVCVCVLNVKMVKIQFGFYHLHSNLNRFILIPFSFHFRFVWHPAIKLLFFSSAFKIQVNFCGKILITIIPTLFQMSLYWMASFPSTPNALKLFWICFIPFEIVWPKWFLCVLYIQFQFWSSVFIKFWQYKLSDNRFYLWVWA